MSNMALLFSILQDPDNLSLHFGNKKIAHKEAGEWQTAIIIKLKYQQPALGAWQHPFL